MVKDDRIYANGYLYDPKIGDFFWVKSPRPSFIRIGQRVGATDHLGYRKIFHEGKKVFSHRLAWFLFYGKWPEKCIDHINGVKSDCSIKNLREAERWQNGANRPAVKGLKGATWHKDSKKWLASMSYKGKKVYLGLHSTEEKAHEAYKAEARKRQGEFFRV